MEELVLYPSLTNLLGQNIVKHMILALTGGNELEANESRDDYLEEECPHHLKVEPFDIHFQISSHCSLCPCEQVFMAFVIMFLYVIGFNQFKNGGL